MIDRILNILTCLSSGTLHGAGSATSTGGVVGSTVGPSLGYIGRRLQVIFPKILIANNKSEPLSRRPHIYVLQYSLG